MQNDIDGSVKDASYNSIMNVPFGIYPGSLRHRRRDQDQNLQFQHCSAVWRTGLYTNQVDWIDWFVSTRILSWLDWVDWLFEMTGWLTRLTLATGWLIWFPKIRVTRMIESIEWKVEISFSWRKIMTPIDDIKDHKTTLKTACHHNCNMG